MPLPEGGNNRWSPPAQPPRYESDSEVDEAAIREEAVRMIQSRSVGKVQDEDSDDDFMSIQSSPKRPSPRVTPPPSAGRIVTDGYVVTKEKPQQPPPQKKTKRPVPPSSSPVNPLRMQDELRALEDGWQVKTVEKPKPRVPSRPQAKPTPTRKPVTFNTLQRRSPQKRSKSSPAAGKPAPQSQSDPAPAPAVSVRSNSKNKTLQKQLIQELKSPGRMLYEKDMREKKKAEKRIAKTIEFKKKLQQSERVNAQQWSKTIAMKELSSLEDEHPWKPPYGGTSPAPPPVSPNGPRRSASPQREIDPALLAVTTPGVAKKKRSLSTPVPAVPSDPRQHNTEAYKLWLAKKEEQARMASHKRALISRQQRQQQEEFQAKRDRQINEALERQREQIERIKKTKPKTPKTKVSTPVERHARFKAEPLVASPQERQNKWMQPPPPRPVESFSPQQELPSITEILNSPYREESINPQQMSIFREVPLLNADYSDDFLQASPQQQQQQQQQQQSDGDALFEQNDRTQSSLDILQEQQVAHELQMQKEALEKELSMQRNEMQQQLRNQQQQYEEQVRQQKQQQQLIEERMAQQRQEHDEQLRQVKQQQAKFQQKLAEEQQQTLELQQLQLQTKEQQQQQLKELEQQQHLEQQQREQEQSSVQFSERQQPAEEQSTCQDGSYSAAPMEYRSYQSHQSLQPLPAERYQPIRNSLIGTDLLAALKGKKRQKKTSPEFKLRLLFMNADHNGDGYVSAEEAFISLAEAGYPEPGDDVANDALSTVDPHSRGVLAFYQFQKLVELMYGEGQGGTGIRNVSPRRTFTDIDVY